MKRKAWIAVGLAVTAAGWVSTRAKAADHLDSDKIAMDPTADITDTYSWVDGSNVAIVMNVAPLGAALKFSDKVQYVMHTSSGSAFSMTTANVDIICTFDAAQKISCWVGDKEYVTGDASGVGGLKSADGKFTVFAGLRSDPFFFNLEGFKDTVATVDAAEGVLKFDMSGCPTVDGATSTTLVGMLQGTAKGAMPAKDTFAMANVLSIVVSIDKSLVTSGGAVMSLWASTNKGG